MIVLIGSALVIGFLHTLSPGHWLPVVLVARARRWSLGTAVLGALTAASGHILVSCLLGIVALEIGVHLVAAQEEKIESYGGLIVAAFGLIYALVAFFRHLRCVGHTHHGPAFSKNRGPFTFLFFMGVSPCVAVLPVFGAAIAKGAFGVIVTLVAFSVGVIGSLVLATLLASFGIMKLDHPLLEHYGDVLTGGAIFVMGMLLFFLSG